MALEIERRFLPASDAWRTQIEHSFVILQGYLSVAKEQTIRVRIVDQQAWLTIKSMITSMSRYEFEYAIDINDAKIMIEKLCPFVIEKTRHMITIEDKIFEIDEYQGINAPLTVIELELTDEQATYPQPAWLGEEVTDSERYTTAYISQHPYSSWNKIKDK